MKLLTLELNNYKSHKHFLADFRNNDGLGENKLIQGNKGSGKTSLKDAFTWIMTGSMVNDPTPVDETGAIINHNVISVEAVFDDGTTIRVESKQSWSKDVLKQNHEATWFIDGTPLLVSAYQEFMNKKIGTIEQRKILCDPTIFAHGDGLKVSGKTPKTSIARRREIVIGIAGAGTLEQELAENEAIIKQTKFALSKNKKDIDEVYAGIESLNDAKIDTSSLSRVDIETSIKNIEQEKTNSLAGLETLNQGNDKENQLKRALSDAQTTLSQERSAYLVDYNNQLVASRKPYNEYIDVKNGLETKLRAQMAAKSSEDERYNALVNKSTNLKLQLQTRLDQHKKESANVYQPSTTSCATCLQPLPVDQLQANEARFNINKSSMLEKIVNEGTELRAQIAELDAQLAIPKSTYQIESIQEQIAALVEPVIAPVPTFEQTPQYVTLQEAVTTAQTALDNLDDDGAKDIYLRAIEGFNEKIKTLNEELSKFGTNDHIAKTIDAKALELQALAEKKDELAATLDECNAFTRTSLDNLEAIIKEKFEGISFKMFDYTIDGNQIDTCITYGQTDSGMIPWESLSGGQKRKSTIMLANAFNKAWGVSVPLFIDDSQIYQDDEVNANMQLIRITEVPYAPLEIK